ncbi:LptA/OstA family protein [Neomegalonema perideroedes]|uniref:LptA/OstA family protein n=1 Tax=Neomegalonema perideroedes TaxID=217219 RepID=UPI00037C3716|nr:LptA/OstA family protein [Neomegalonema perideroedes]
MTDSPQTSPAPRRLGRAWAALALLAAFSPAAPALGQAGLGALGGFRQNPNLPIEIAADSLEVRQSEQRAVFSGGVDARQGELRLQAQRVEVVYAGDGGASAASGAQGAIRSLRAEGDVFITNGSETAQGSWAEYDVAGGVALMGDDVILTQGENVIRGPRLRIDLNSGQARLEGGRVQTLFRPEGR